jgi:uncharacterized membrane protein
MIDDVTVARALHVIAVLHWIGGLAMVTLVVLPLARTRRAAEEGIALFEGIERRFAAQVRLTIPLAGATGFWMTYRLELWEHFIDPHFWWMTAMLVLWLAFMTMLFVVEPLLQTRFSESMRTRFPETSRRLLIAHAFLLGAALLTVFGAVAGAHGLQLF